MNITVVGAGYVGLSLAVLLAQKNNVKVLDNNSEKIRLINQKKSPIKDELLTEYLNLNNLSLVAVDNKNTAYSNAEFIVIAVPTNYDSNQGKFDTSILDSVIKEIDKANSQATIVIKSTVPVGYTKAVQEKTKNTIVFSPEFLRESKALYDNLHPSRIIVGTNLSEKKSVNKATTFAKILKDNSLEDTKVHIMEATEAESVKLFSNTYLALRVSFFNELDTFAETKGMNTKTIIDAVCDDPRIGAYYNNPSFGYGGYCLPKDTKQLLANYEGVPEKLINAIVDSNQTRKEYIASRIIELLDKNSNNNRLEKSNYIVGIYRLTMKKDSDNFRESSIRDVMKLLREKGVKVIIYEPIITNDTFHEECEVVNDIKVFIDKSDIILANRYENELESARGKVYTRDLFNSDT